MDSTVAATAGDSSRPWQTLSSGFERARSREDSLDRCAASSSLTHEERTDQPCVGMTELRLGGPSL